MLTMATVRSLEGTITTDAGSELGPYSMFRSDEPLNKRSIQVPKEAWIDLDLYYDSGDRWHFIERKHLDGGCEWTLAEQTRAPRPHDPDDHSGPTGYPDHRDFIERLLNEAREEVAFLQAHIVYLDRQEQLDEQQLLGERLRGYVNDRSDVLADLGRHLVKAQH